MPGVVYGAPRIPSDPSGYSSWMAQQFGPNWGQKWSDTGGNLGQFGPGQPMPSNLSGGGTQPWKDPSSWDPRSITGSEPYKKLMGFANQGSGAPAQARQDVSPAMNWMNRALSTNDPLGTAGVKQLIENQGMSSLRNAGAQARNRLDNTFGGVNAAASPEGMALAREMTRQNEAAGIGNVESQAQQAGIQERQATASFQQGVSQSLANLGLGLGGLQVQDLGQQQQAAIAAGQMESMANQSWAQIMGSLLGSQLYGRSWSPAQPIAPGQTEPYPAPGAPGTFQGGQNADPFGLLNGMWNAEQNSGPSPGSFSKYNPWGSKGGSNYGQIGNPISGGNYSGPGNETPPPF